jgi:hypothetical protein
LVGQWEGGGSAEGMRAGGFPVAPPSAGGAAQTALGQAVRRRRPTAPALVTAASGRKEGVWGGPASGRKESAWGGPVPASCTSSSAALDEAAGCPWPQSPPASAASTPADRLAIATTAHASSAGHSSGKTSTESTACPSGARTGGSSRWPAGGTASWRTSSASRACQAGSVLAGSARSVASSALCTGRELRNSSGCVSLCSMHSAAGSNACAARTACVWGRSGRSNQHAALVPQPVGGTCAAPGSAGRAHLLSPPPALLLQELQARHHAGAQCLEFLHLRCGRAQPHHRVQALRECEQLWRPGGYRIDQ